MVHDDDGAGLGVDPVGDFIRTLLTRLFIWNSVGVSKGKQSSNQSGVNALLLRIFSLIRLGCCDDLARPILTAC